MAMYCCSMDAILRNMKKAQTTSVDGPQLAFNKEVMAELKAIRAQNSGRKSQGSKSKGHGSKGSLNVAHTTNTKFQKRDMSTVRCYKCNKMGHYKRECPN